jgi:hypothetical protein
LDIYLALKLKHLPLTQQIRQTTGALTFGILLY